MKVTFTMFGYEVASVTLDLPAAPPPSPLDKAAKRISRWWVNRMVG